MISEHTQKLCDIIATAPTTSEGARSVRAVEVSYEMSQETMSDEEKMAIKQELARWQMKRMKGVR